MALEFRRKNPRELPGRCGRAALGLRVWVEGLWCVLPQLWCDSGTQKTHSHPLSQWEWGVAGVLGG